MKNLLVCLSHHSAPGRIEYLRAVIENLLEEYALSLDIIVDTNVPQLLDVPGEGAVTIVSHSNLEHPFWLTWCHRKHMAQRIDEYEWVAYFEDDMLLPFVNFQAYVRHWEMLWPAFVPGLVRVEKHNGEQWCVDQTQHQPLQHRIPHFVALTQPYQACWLMPRQALKETMGPGFVRLSDSREVAASYPMADLGKTALVQVDGGHITRESLVYHISNSYAPCPTSPHGKIRIADIFA